LVFAKEKMESDDEDRDKASSSRYRCDEDEDKKGELNGEFNGDSGIESKEDKCRPTILGDLNSCWRNDNREDVSDGDAKGWYGGERRGNNINLYVGELNWCANGKRNGDVGKEEEEEEKDPDEIFLCLGGVGRLVR